MSLQACIDDAKAKGSYDGDALVVFDSAQDGGCLLTLAWDGLTDRWHSRCSDAERSFSYSAPKGAPELDAIVGSLNGYLDIVNGRSTAGVVLANAWARGTVKSGQ